MDAVEIIVRLVGAFYAAGGVFGLRALLTDALLDKAIAAISMKPEPELDRRRRRFLAAISWLTWLCGISLLMMSLWALPFFVAALVVQAWWFVWAARNDPPEGEADAAGRRRSTNASIAFGIVGIGVVWLVHEDRLHGWADPLAGLVIAASTLLVAWWFWRRSSMVAKPLGSWSALDADESEPEEPVLPERLRFEFTGDGWPLRDADGDGALDHFDFVDQDIALRIENWLSHIQQGEGEDAGERTRAEGRAIAKELASRFGRDRLVSPYLP